MNSFFNCFFFILFLGEWGKT